MNKTDITRTVRIDEVSGTVGWRGDEKSDFAVLMTNADGSTVWLLSRDWSMYGTLYGFDRVARVVRRENLDPEIAEVYEEYTNVRFDLYDAFMGRCIDITAMFEMFDVSELSESGDVSEESMKAEARQEYEIARNAAYAAAMAKVRSIRSARNA